MNGKITFPRISPRTWKGNGFGYEPATYGIMLDGRRVGTISPSALGWHLDMDAETTRGWFTHTLADAKARARDVSQQHDWRRTHYGKRAASESKVNGR